MNLKEWAKREVELLCNKEAEDIGYIKKCTESALKAYNILMEDDHSDFTIKATTKILNDLLKGKPLTPIEENNEKWKLIHTSEENDTYQCIRYTKLFKDVNKKTGEIKYRDIDMIECINIKNSKSIQYNNFVRNVCDEYIEDIILPYNPSKTKSYQIFIEDFSTIGDIEVFDTLGIFVIRTPKNDTIGIYRYFKEDKSSRELIEISKEEYEERKNTYIENIGVM